MSKEEFIRLYNDPDKEPVKFRHKMSFYPSKKCNRENCQEECSGGCPLYWTKFNPEEVIKGKNRKKLSISI